MTARRSGCSRWLLLILLLVPAFFVYKHYTDQAEQRRRDDEIATAEGLVKVVSETFHDQFQLKVASISGKMDVTSIDNGPIFRTSQRATVPYSVDYFVNLAKLGGSDLTYSPTYKELRVEIADVTIADPNIDEARIKILDRGGFWRTTRAGENLSRRTSQLAVKGAQKSAREPAKVQEARDSARAKIGSLLKKPLEAANLEGVKVVIRFPTDGADDPSYINLSTPYAQAIQEHHRRAAERKK